MTTTLSELSFTLPKEDFLTDPAFWRSDIASRGQNFRVASLHVDGWLGSWHKRRELLIDLWDKIEADVLLLQGACARSGEDQVLETAQHLGYEHVVNAVGLRDGFDTESCAVLSRLPLLDAHVEMLPGLSTRLVAGAVIQVGQKKIRLASAHVPQDSYMQAAKSMLGLGHGHELILGCCLCVDADKIREVISHSPCSFAGDLAEPSYPVLRHQQLRLWNEKMKDGGQGLDLIPKRCDVIIQRGLQAERAGLMALVHNGVAVSGHALVWADYVV